MQKKVSDCDCRDEKVSDCDCRDFSGTFSGVKNEKIVSLHQEGLVTIRLCGYGNYTKG